MEPESASLYCRSMRAFRESSTKDKPKLISFPPGSVYMVVDCGGKGCGTILNNRSFYVYHFKHKQLNYYVSNLKVNIETKKKMVKNDWLLQH